MKLKRRGKILSIQFLTFDFTFFILFSSFCYSESSPNKKSTSTTSKEPITNTSTTGGVGQTPSASTYNNNYAGYNSGTSNSQYYGGNQPYQSYDSYGYNHWQQSGYGYSGYGQWSGYGNYY